MPIHTRNLTTRLREFSSRSTGSEHLLGGLFQEALTEGRVAEYERWVERAFQEGRIDPAHLSITALWDSLVPNGRTLREEILNPSLQSAVVISEADVNTSGFSNIIGQIIYTTMLGAYDDPEFIGTRLVNTIPTRFDGEKIAGVASLDDVAESIAEGDAYPEFNVGEDYVETPSTTKRGFIVPITKEAIFFDRTGQVVSQASNVGRSLGINKEKRILQVVLGITNNYKPKGQGTYNTYQTAAGAGSHQEYVNSLTSTPFEDWQSIEAVDNQLANQVDPNTSEPISATVRQIVCPRQLRTKVRVQTGAEQVRNTFDTANDVQSLSPNPFPSMSVESNAWVDSVGGSSTTWFGGDFQRAFAYMENWPITVTPNVAGSEAEFTKDIVARYKCSERGAAVAINPRYVVKCAA